MSEAWPAKLLVQFLLPRMTAAWCCLLLLQIEHHKLGTCLVCDASVVLCVAYDIDAIRQVRAHLHLCDLHWCVLVVCLTAFLSAA